MSLEKIIEHAIGHNPVKMQEAFEEEMAERVRTALEEKYKKMKEEDDEDDDDEDDEDDNDDDKDDDDEVEESSCGTKKKR